MVHRIRSAGLSLRIIRTFLSRTIRAVRILASDRSIPKPLRWLAALGLLPIPGPADEAIVLLVAATLVLFYRSPLRQAWQQAAARS